MKMSNIRKVEPRILFIGSHKRIIQSVLDFDFIAGKKTPSVSVIVAGGRKYEKYFFGTDEILIPVFSSLEKIPEKLKKEINYFYNVSSARRSLESSKAALHLPSLIAGSLFAENIPEKHSILLAQKAIEEEILLIGPSSVGLLVPGILKLGAVGGVEMHQLVDSNLFSPGSVAVFSSSGGMTNELIRVVVSRGKRVSFALSFGGDRFPLMTPREAFLMAEDDKETNEIIYFGELGGQDEYELVSLIEEKKIHKKVICYIGGVVADLFDTPPQFGHAKAMAKKKDESARAKRDALKKAGVMVGETFDEFVSLIGEKNDLKSDKEMIYTERMNSIAKRQSSLITTTISHDENDDVKILGEDLLSFTDKSFARIVILLLLGRREVTKQTEDFVDFVLRLLVDHGPYVSGAVNTIITARAGRDLVSSLASGLLTIGPRFGGAINQAAFNFLNGVKSNQSADEFVELFAQKKEYISGIGHKKYRIDLPDPRVKKILSFTNLLNEKKYTNFAQSIEKITVSKKGNLILNVDGAIAAVMLDMLAENEKYTSDELEDLVKIEFFNALFVLSRSVGFVSHFLDQKRLDEGLLRLTDKDVSYIEKND